MPRRPKAYRRIGAPLRNENAVKHGAYKQIWDGRRRESKLVGQIEAELVAALGGDPSPQEVLLIQRAAVKALRCRLAEAEIIGQGAQGSGVGRLAEDYLKWTRELRRDLEALGLERRVREVVPSLSEYLDRGTDDEAP